MPTAALFTGRMTDVLFKDPPSYGAVPSGDWQRINIYSSEIAPSRTEEDNPILGIAGASALDPADPAPGLYSLAGTLRVPLCLNQLGYWLKLAFGAPATTGAGDVTHVFKSGAAVLPDRAMETKKGPALFDQDLGLVARSIRFAMAKEAGFRGVDLDVIGKKQNVLTASAGGAPIAAPELLQMPSVLGIVRWNDVAAGKALSADLTYTTGMDGERYLDGAPDPDTISEVLPSAETSATGTIRLRGVTASMDLDARTRTPRELELEYALGPTRSLVITMPRVFLALSGKPISGPGPTEQSFTFRAAQTSAAPMMTVVLKNGVAAY